MTTLYGVPALSQDDFNRLTQINPERTPFTWEIDANSNQRVDPNEVIIRDGFKKKSYVKRNEFTEQFKSAYLTLVEFKRREVVERSLAEANDVRVPVDFSSVRPEEKEMIKHIMAASKLIDALYLEQTGAAKLLQQMESLKTMHPESYALFERNRGPWCEAPETASDPFCNAHPNFPKNEPGVYPEGLIIDEDFCASLEGDVASPMTIVKDGADSIYQAIPYHVAYQGYVEAIAIELEAAAESIKNVEDEKLLNQYLLAAAESFRTDEWLPSDRLWVSMNGSNSKYALRIAPDESYWEPCQGKAGYELWFGRINTDAVEAAQKFDSIKYDLEDQIASLTPYYDARDIELEVPSFVELALVTGDGDHPRGGMLGQALPNWTYKETGFRSNIFLGIGRNPEAREMLHKKASLLLDPDTMNYFSTDDFHGDMNVAGHELTHCLGPGLACAIVNPETGEPVLNEDGTPMTIKDKIGGRKALGLEEFKAETGNIFLIGYFLERGLITEEEAKQRYVRQLMWALKKISGLASSDNTMSTYTNIAAKQVNWLMDEGAIWYIDGKFHINFERYHEAITKLLALVLKAKTTGDESAINQLFESNEPGSPVYENIHVADTAQKTSGFPGMSYTYEVVGIDS